MYVIRVITLPGGEAPPIYDTFFQGFEEDAEGFSVKLGCNPAEAEMFVRPSDATEYWREQVNAVREMAAFSICIEPLLPN